jgi:hypothetical protein
MYKVLITINCISIAKRQRKRRVCSEYDIDRYISNICIFDACKYTHLNLATTTQHTPLKCYVLQIFPNLSS